MLADSKKLVTRGEDQHQGGIKLEETFLSRKIMLEINPIDSSPVQETFEHFLS